MEFYLGIDIGGTKCAVVLKEKNSSKINDKIRFETLSSRGYKQVIEDIIAAIEEILRKNAISPAQIIRCGISCGGPLDPKKGVIMSPPNLPDWENVPICDIITKRFSFPCKIANDADACALAEWKFGAGKGAENMIFLTFGTGMGAGLILNGKLYCGSTGTAGEVGHIRLKESGPLGYGKHGSFEGFCSGGGIANMAKDMLENYSGKTELRKAEITAKAIAFAANNGDEFALSVYDKCGQMLGYGISILIDILNPEKIVIGSIYQRSEGLLKNKMNEIISKEALKINSAACRIVPSQLADSIGDWAAIGVAI